MPPNKPLKLTAASFSRTVGRARHGSWYHHARPQLSGHPLDGAMGIEAVQADARFDNTAFSNVIIDGKALPLTATYTCPRCGEQVGFTKQNLEHRAERQLSNHSPQLQRLFNAWATQNGQAGSPFLDWSCPGCQLAVRVYVHPWAGGRHGDAGVDLAVVLEAEQRE